MIPFEKRIDAFKKLGTYLNAIGDNKKSLKFISEEVKASYDKLDRICNEVYHYNVWFDQKNVRKMLNSLGESMNDVNIDHWIYIKV